MNNSNQPLEENESKSLGKASWPLIAFIILVVVAIAVAWQFTGNKPVEAIIEKPMPAPVKSPVVEPEVKEEVIVEEPVAPELVSEELDVVEEVVEPIVNPLPTLGESDDWLKVKLPEITWRKELLKLIIDEDMIRRFVVFTDNFAQGAVAYEHSPFVLPNIKFAPESSTSQGENISESKQKVWQWNEESSKRFSLYVDLLRSMDSESLVQWYLEMKPLIDEAYSELGYDDDFTNTLQDAMTRVLDLELPKSSMAIVQPSVMYKFANPQLESLPASDKLLLRLGKDNLLIIKSVLLELHEKLAQQANGVH